MPLDLENLRAQKEKDLQDLIDSHSSVLNDNIERRRKLALGQREDFFSSAISPIVSQSLRKTGVTPTGIPAERENTALDASLEAALRNQKIGESKANLGLNLNNLGRRVDTSHAEQLEKSGFLNTQSALTQSEDFQAQEAEKQRQLKIQEDAIADEYARRGLEAELSYDPSAYNYDTALATALGSIAGLGLSYGIYKGLYPNPTLTQSNPVSQESMDFMRQFNPPGIYRSTANPVDLLPASVPDTSYQDFLRTHR